MCVPGGVHAYCKIVWRTVIVTQRIDLRSALVLLLVNAAAARHNTLVMVCPELRPDRPRRVVMESLPRIAPKRTQKPPSAYWYGLLGSGGWLVGWPVLYAFVESKVPKNAAF